jgi:MoxR-like ATPase
MNDESLALCAELSRRLVERVLAPIKSSFVGKDDIVDLMGVCLVGGEHLFL